MWCLLLKKNLVLEWWRILDIPLENVFTMTGIDYDMLVESRYVPVNCLLACSLSIVLWLASKVEMLQH
jgi:hypothetical protein